jgi:predicted TIM-barrel fold metal-dependent hydrolase
MNSSTLTGRAPKAKRAGMRIVDVDVHAHESPAALAPYTEMPWRKSLEQLAKVPARYLDIPGFAPVLGQFPPTPPGVGNRRTTVTSAKQMREDLDEMGIDIGILFPDHFLTHAAIKQDDYAVAIARAYNRWLVDEWLGEDNGLKGTIIAPHHSPTAAAEEVRRYADHRNVVGIYLPTSCVEPLYGHRRYNPLYEAAQETGLPVMFHSVTAIHPVFPFNLNGYESTFAAHAIAHPFSLIANLVSMMETGVPARYPNLKIAFTEGGVAWVPWVMMRLDKEYLERRREVPWLTERPSSYIRQMFFATQPVEEPEHLQDMVTLLSLFGGQDSVMFASDWPHHDFDHPNKVLQIPVSDEVRRKIMGGNAARLLNLELKVTA